jgi:YHS domain-containing protein
MKRLFITLILSSIIYTLGYQSLVAQGNMENVYATSSGAIEGYDPVAYFSEGKPVEGKVSITYDWMGATWHFATEEHKSVFMENPEKYAPEYGGFCAYAVSQGYKAEIDPDAWHIEGGKLYLNYNKNVHKKWMENRKELIKEADKNWKEISGK